MLKGRIETNKNRHRAGELVTLLDEPYLAFLFNDLPSPPSAPAVGAIFFWLGRYSFSKYHFGAPGSGGRGDRHGVIRTRLCFLFFVGAVESSPWWGGRAHEMEEKISRCRHSIHTGISCTFTWSPYLPCSARKVLLQNILTSIRTAKKNTIFAIFHSLDFFGLVDEFENWKELRANTLMRLFCWSWNCDSEWSLSRYVIHRNHGVAACAGTQKQHLSGR
jgi:hypothetical protein